MIFETISVNSKKRNQIIDITAIVESFVKESSVKTGLLQLFVPHTTAAITINENADPTVKKDIILGLNKISPILKQFDHFEGNSDSHIKSSLVGCSLQIIINDNNLTLGTWQGIYFCEFDGPRIRKVNMSIIEG